MTIHNNLKKLTVHVRKTKGSAEAMRFYLDFIQPMKEYFGGNEEVKNIDI